MKKSHSVPSLIGRNLTQDQQFEMAVEMQISEKLWDLFGQDAKYFLEQEEVSASLFLRSYDPNDYSDEVDFIVEVASQIVTRLENSNGWLTKLYLQLLQVGIDKKNQIVIDNSALQVENQDCSVYLDKLMKKGNEIAREARSVITSQRPSKKEKQKIAESLVYAIAALQDPFNKDLGMKLEKNASQTVGAQSKLIQFFSAVGALAGLVMGICGAPFTFGASVPLACAGGVFLLIGSASFFYHREKSIAKEMSGLGSVMKSMPSSGLAR